jgi:hypothetical protein
LSEALNASAPPVLVPVVLLPLLLLVPPVEPVLGVELLLEQAASVSPASDAHAVIAIDLRLFMSGTVSFPCAKSLSG